MSLTPELDGTGPCDWPLVYANCDMKALDSLDPETYHAVERSAIEYLWSWTGRVYGTCTAVVRPCRRGCAQTPIFWNSPLTRYAAGSGAPYAAPAFQVDNPDTLNPAAPTAPASEVAAGEYVVPGATVTEPVPGEYHIETQGEDDSPVLAAWADYSCGCSGSSCGCEDENAYTMRLPGRVVSVESVLIDGQVLPSTAYRVDNHAILVRTDGGVWPTCQDLALDPTQEGTFQVSYTRGAAVPYGGQLAAGILALEMAKRLCNDNTCSLPSRVQSVTRQGVSMVVLDNFAELQEGRTGIWLVDSWLVSMTKPRRPMGVFSVDVPRRAMRETTAPSLPLSPTKPLPAVTP